MARFRQDSFYKNQHLPGDAVGGTVIFSERQQQFQDRQGQPRTTVDFGDNQSRPYTEIFPKGYDESEIAKRVPDYKILGKITPDTTISRQPAPRFGLQPRM